MKSLLLLSFLLFSGCSPATNTQLTRPPETVGLSDTTKAELEEMIREVVREELASLQHDHTPPNEEALRSIIREELNKLKANGSSAVAEALKEAERKNEERQLEEKKTNADKLVMTCVRIASDIQAWKRKPAAFGGGANVEGFTGLTLQKLGYPVDAENAYTTMEGIYTLIVGSEQVKIVGVSPSYQNQVTVKVTGVNTTDIHTEIKSLSLK